MVLTPLWMVPISTIFEPTKGLTLASYPSHPLMVGSAAPMTRIVNVWFMSLVQHTPLMIIVHASQLSHTPYIFPDGVTTEPRELVFTNP